MVVAPTEERALFRVKSFQATYPFAFGAFKDQSLNLLSFNVQQAASWHREERTK